MFEVLKFNSDYEIEKEFPHRIRKIWKTNFISEREKNNGYIYIDINRIPVLKHRLIAQQFIENNDPDTKIYVDHINRIRNDNRLENLRWVTPSENYRNSHRPTTCNRQANEYLNKLPPDTEVIEEYNGYEFDRYFYDTINERILMKTKSGKIKVVNTYMDRNLLLIQFFDVNDKKCKFSYNKLIEYLKNNY